MVKKCECTVITVKNSLGHKLV